MDKLIYNPRGLNGRRSQPLVPIYCHRHLIQSVFTKPWLLIIRTSLCNWLINTCPSISKNSVVHYLRFQPYRIQFIMQIHLNLFICKITHKDKIAYIWISPHPVNSGTLFGVVVAKPQMYEGKGNYTTALENRNRKAQVSCSPASMWGLTSR